MKAIKNLSLLFFLGLIVVSCVKDDDYDIPEVNVDEPNIDANFTIQNVKDIYGGFEPVIIEAGEDSETPLFIEAYVVSSDESGNFYKQIIIQNTPENPTAGISISTEATDLYTKYEPGRKIYFRVDGLYSGVFAGLPTLGTQDGDEIGRISIKEFNDRIFRSQEVVDIVPKEITISQAGTNESLLNTLVKLSGVEFADGELGESYGNIDDTFSVNRSVVNCNDDEIILRNSGFADFKNLPLPEGNGMLTAVLSTFNGTNQLFIRNTSDVMFDGERCEDETTNTELPFSEDFENYPAGPGEIVSIDQWTNVNANGGERLWEIRDFDNNQYAQTSAFNSGESPYEAWLVTPGFDLQGVPSGTFSFDTKDGFYNGTALSVYVSTDFSGDPNTATWTELTATFSTGNTDGYGDDYVSSGNIDLSEYAGEVVYFGFRYQGGDGGVSTTYQIDNVSVTE